MPDWITDSQPYETPIEAAAPNYAKIAPSFGESFGAMFQEGSPITFAQRAVERGAYEGSSGFDQALGDIGAGQAGDAPPPRIKTPMMSAADANKTYAPDGTTITDRPIEEGLAQVLGKQKAQQVERQGILSRYAENTGPIARFATGTAAFLMDPLNVATTFVPGIGEEAILAKLGYAGAHAAPLVARASARAAAGFTAGAAGQFPLSALKYGVSQEEGGDYDLRQAALDMATGGALNAAVHAGVAGPLGDLFKAWRGRGAAGAAVEEGARALPPDPILEAPPQTRYAAMGTAVSQIAEGRMVDTVPIFDEIGARSTAEEAMLRQQHAEVTEQLAALPEGNVEARDKLYKLGQIEQAANAEGVAPGARRALMEQRDELLTNTNPEELQAQAAPLDQTRQLQDKLARISDRLNDIAADAAQRRADVSLSPTPFDPQALAQIQSRMYDNGFSPGMPQTEFDSVYEAVYGKKEEGAEASSTQTPPPARAPSGSADGKPATPAEAAVADLEARWKSLQDQGGVTLLPEEKAELDATAQRAAKANSDAEGYQQAASCLAGAGI